MQRIIFFGVLLSYLATASAQQKNLYAILVGDIAETDGIGGGVQQDLQTAHNALKRMTQLGGYAYQPRQVLRGKKAMTQEVLTAIRAVPRNADVVVFYYSGHGTCSTNHLPKLHTSAATTDYLATQTAIAELRKRSPRLVWVMTDCCNAPSTTYSNAATYYSPAATIEEEHIRALLAQKGEVIMTACRYGETAYMNEKGSYFTAHFFAAFTRLTRLQQAPTWKSIFDAAAAATTDSVQREKKDTQTPYADIQVQ